MYENLFPKYLYVNFIVKYEISINELHTLRNSVLSTCEFLQNSHTHADPGGRPVYKA
jgi:hypothetical protein